MVKRRVLPLIAVALMWVKHIWAQPTVSPTSPRCVISPTGALVRRRFPTSCLFILIHSQSNRATHDAAKPTAHVATDI